MTLSRSCHKKMLRYFYFISLFFCINCTLCDPKSNRGIDLHKRRRAGRVKKSSNNDRHGLDQRNEYDYKSPVQQFDVASFVQGSMQGSNEDVEDDQPYGFRIKKGNSRSSNNYDYEFATNNENNKKRGMDRDYLIVGSDNTPELKFNSALFKDAVSPTLSNMNELTLDDTNKENPGYNNKKDYLSDQAQKYNPVNKCAIRNIKFPFFSRNKSTLKPKKHKKRKLICFNCSKKPKVERKKIEDVPNIPMKVKRSEDYNPCSTRRTKQKRNVEDDTQKKKSSNIIIHNSRQFYQNIDKLDKLGPTSKKLNPDNAGMPTVRNKRDQLDRERQLKELEEVQKKIDSVEIHMPTFEKKPSI